MDRIRHDASRESGFSLIEVLVAMMVFALFALCVALTLTSGLSMTREARAREVATNLAAQEIDYARAADDPFNLFDRTTTAVVNGQTFTVARTTRWVTGDQNAGACGTGAGTLKYKRINISVTWTGMRGATPVTANTLLAPKTRINDPSKGTIIVSVVGVTGTGTQGITVSAAPAATNPNGAAALTTSPSPTNADGCSYILKVAPGNYDVKISKTGYVDQYQHADSSTVTDITVAAGASVSTSFVFDAGMNFTPTLPTGTVPTNLDISYVNNYGVVLGSTAPRTLMPYDIGYQVMAGAYVQPQSGGTAGCLSVDPDAWTTANGSGFVGHRDDFAAATPGGASVAVRMARVTVANLKDKFITAVTSVTPGSGDPGCAVAMTYTFPKLTSNSQVLLLPYGSWALYYGDASASKANKVGSSNVIVSAPDSQAQTSGLVTVTMDPRIGP